MEDEDWIKITSPDKEKIKEALRLFDELAYDEKIVANYSDREMIKLLKRKMEEIKKVLTS